MEILVEEHILISSAHLTHPMSISLLNFLFQNITLDTRLILVVILHYVQISNHYILQLKTV